MSYDSWGSTWNNSWGVSWVHPAPTTTPTDKHDGFWDIEDDTPKRLEEYRLRKDELHEQITRAFEDITGETEVPTVEHIVQVQQSKPLERKALQRIKDDRIELEEINHQILMLSKQLQDQEMRDIAFIVSLL